MDNSTKNMFVLHLLAHFWTLIPQWWAVWWADGLCVWHVTKDREPQNRVCHEISWKECQCCVQMELCAKNNVEAWQVFRVWSAYRKIILTFTEKNGLLDSWGVGSFHKGKRKQETFVAILFFESRSMFFEVPLPRNTQQLIPSNYMLSFWPVQSKLASLVMGQQKHCTH